MSEISRPLANRRQTIKRITKRIARFFDAWLSYSVRRELLDGDLALSLPFLHGNVLEIGNGHGQRRGKFSPPLTQVESWCYVDLTFAHCPDILADAHSLPFQDNSFDAIVMLEVSEYLREPSLVLAQFRRVLKKGGYLVISTPFFHRRDNQSDLWRYTDMGFSLLLQNAGFKLVSLRSQGGALVCVASILKYALYSIPSAKLRISLTALAYWPLRLLCHYDGMACQKMPVLATYSTGYLAVAQNPKDPEDA